MTDSRGEIAFEGKLFRVRLVPVSEHKTYEFVERIGAATILPIVTSPEGPVVLTIRNERLHYGSSVGLPGGNCNGGFDHPEPPHQTALRELREETGYGYGQSTEGSLDVFRLRTGSSTIGYDRFFAVARNVVEIVDADDNPHEVVTLRPMSLEDYVAPIVDLNRGELYPEVNLAFAKAAKNLGVGALIGWLAGDDTPGADRIPQHFDPWMTQVAA